MFSSSRKMNFMSSPASRARWGCVIGRFQPFHRDHFTLVEAAFEDHGRVIVAISGADPTWQVEVSEAPHRHLGGSNPFTFWQRAELIRAALADVIPMESLRIMPFPIHRVALWPHYLPDDVECWVRDRGAWEARKIQELQRRYRVRVLPAVGDEVSGTKIRELLTANDPAWRDFVPRGVAGLIDQWLLDGSFRRMLADLHASK
jgi:nicotinamide mononucleotide adenylyltransferase